MHEPGAPVRRSARKSSLGFSTPSSPASVIRKTPTSWVEPKRFLLARSRRKACPRSPSKPSTTSTRCSSTRGPASVPSLVTCPIRISAAPRLLAVAASSAADSRTCATEPGADSTRSVASVWIESTSTTAGASAAPRLGERLDPRLGQHEDLLGNHREALRAQAQLLRALLAGDVEEGAERLEARRELERERALADPRLAAEQHHAAGHQAAAQHAVELGDPGREPRRRGGLDLAQHARLARGRRPRLDPQQVARPAPGGAGRGLLDQRRPGAALGAAPEPARLLRAAGGAGVDRAARGPWRAQC